MFQRVFFLLLIVCTGRFAEAHLGASFETSEKKVATKHELYTVYETKSDSNDVREYVSNDGKIFGIAWNGLNHPDLEPLLGKTYYDHYKTISNDGKHKHQRHYLVQSKKLHVHFGGHMRAFRGTIHDPALLPTGVKIEEIK